MLSFFCHTLLPTWKSHLPALVFSVNLAVYKTYLVTQATVKVKFLSRA